MILGKLLLLCAGLAVAACGRSTPAPGPLPGTAMATDHLPSTPYPAPSLPPTQTPYVLPATQEPSPAASESPTPAGSRLNQILDFWFVDELHGWLTASICDSNGTCKLGLRETLNGGHDWNAIPAPQVPVSFFETDQVGVHSVRFLDAMKGWLYGPDLYATADGGQTWQEEKLPGSVLEIEPVSQAGAWALVSECGESGECGLRLYSNQGTGSNWEKLPDQPGLSGRGGRLLRIATNRDESGQIHQGTTFEYDWVLGQTGSGQNGLQSWGLAFSVDRGASWTNLTIPCKKNPIPAVMSAAEPQTLWLICAGGMGAGSQLKQLYISSNGGHTWTEKPDPPSAGYADAIAAVSEYRAFFGLGRGTLLGTVDGGNTWNEALPIETANPGGWSGWVIRFYQNAYGWAALEDRLFRTTTSGHDWEEMEIRMKDEG